MPSYKNVFDDYITEPEAASNLKNVFDDTVESIDKKGIEFKFEGRSRTPTDIDQLFYNTGIDKLKTKHPNLYGMVGGAVETARDIGDWAVDMIPALKYARPDDRERFMSLSKNDQSIAILHEAAGAMLWAGAMKPMEALALIPQIGKGIYGAGATTFKALKTGYTPVVDIGFKGWKSASTRGTFMNWAKKKGYPKGRAENAYEFGSGETTAVHDTSKQIWEIYTLEQELASETVKGFGSTVNKTSTGMRNAFKGWASKRFGSAGGKNGTMETASEPIMKEFHRWFAAESPELHATAMRAAQGGEALGKNLHGFINLYPIRFVLGAGEKAWGTFSKVYRPIETATKLKNRSVADNISRLYEMLQESGLGTITKKGRFKPDPMFNKSVKAQAYKYITEADNIYESVRQGAMTAEASEAALGNIINKAAPEFPLVRRLIDVGYEYMDHLYAQHTAWKMREIFDRAGVTAAGADSLDIIFKKEIEPALKELFKAKNGHNATNKVLELQKILERLRIEVEMPGMFRGMGGEIKTAADTVFKDLQYEADDGIMSYLGGYAARIIKRDFQSQDISFKLMASERMPFYTKERSATQAVGRAEDFDSMLYLRTNAQAKEMFYNKTLSQVSSYVNKNLPEDYKTYISHWVARLHGIPSQMDHHMARVLNNTIPGTWDARRVFNMTKTVNDFTYMGILGLKPFSAMRNLFQPAITLPPTLGKGFIKGWETMIKGYAKLRDPEMIGYLNEIGVITDYAPELMKMTNIFKIPKSIRIGSTSFAMPSQDAVRDFTMWLFSGSDRLNRYVSGAAASVQWEEGMALWKTGERTVNKIMKATAADKRPEWIQMEIRDLLRRGQVDTAKKSFVTDVVAGSQWLYGPMDAPIITQTWGSIGRQMAVFQSWWAHYGANLEQWAMTGKGPGGSVERMLSWGMSSAVVATAMSGVWGTGTAGRSTFLGPFAGAASKVNDPYMAALMVPAWRPVIQSAELAIKAGQLIGGASPAELSAVKRQSKALLKTAFNFVPGGNIGYQVHGKLFQKGKPGIVPSGYEFKSAIKTGLGMKGF